MRAAVLGTPIAHSLSPVLHEAAFVALGLDWTYERIECDAERLPGLVAAADADWVGFSVTMPGKFAALATATERTDRAAAVGSANTLVRTGGGWLADCTDIDGAAAMLDEVGAPAAAGTALVVGAGGSALPTIAALAERGCARVTVASRSRERADGALRCAAAFGVEATWVALDPTDLVRVGEVDVVCSTVPAVALAGELASVLAGLAPAVTDAIYEPWPTPLAAAAGVRGAAVVGGLTMLLHQAFRQSELFTGRPAPRAEMAAALAAARSA
ncbi:shikimate dehydrogenase [Tsukamurella sp. 8F]|uniref:shikimate dehydrogenase n=1 Tax=unclassified Tsukamurella TaxID=2633480 RepID=UPI0023B9E56C|nr:MULTISPECIES: shikimate dehydrogenase [unclassified Tsukamurella]MDF0529177.1 shikimate dehydrogenase [Tsukamurella sp. 8J]MDF0585362.1 shikimate dehydrogenase [Tsukamurella sp. 8F]